jgi:hypothetical protein
MVIDAYAWVGFIAFIILLLAIDLRIQKVFHGFGTGS